MSDYVIHFTRYNKQRAQRLNSAAWHTRADSFNEAVANAGLFLQGMREAGCTDELEIASIENRGYGGIKCTAMGPTIWTEPETEPAD